MLDATETSSLPVTSEAGREWWLGFLAPLAVGAAFIVAAAIMTGGRLDPPLDDALIFFQFAKNTARGYIMTYAVGEGPTAGCTSLLWMWFLTGAWAVGFRGVALGWFAALAGWGLLGVTGVLVFKLLRRFDIPRTAAAYGSSLLALAGPIPYAYIGGTETGLFTFLILAAVYFTFVKRLGWFVTIAGSLTWARPEGIVVAGLLGGYYLLFSGKPTRRYWLLAIIPAAALAWAAFMYATVGELKTNSYYAKSPLAADVGHSHAPDYARFRYWRNPLYSLKTQFESAFGYVQRFDLLCPLVNDKGPYYAIALDRFLTAKVLRPIIWGAGAAGLVLAFIRRRRFAFPAVLAFAALLVINAVVLGDEHFFYQRSRYGVPELALALVFGAAAWGWLARGPRGRLWPAAFAAAVFLPSTAVWGFTYAADCAFATAFYKPVVDYLKHHFPPDTVVATHDAGFISYYSDMRIIDYWGLGGRRYAEALREGGGSVFEQLERESPRPDVFVLYPGGAEAGIAPLLGTRLRAYTFSEGGHSNLIMFCRPDYGGTRSHTPHTPPYGMTLADGVDVADLTSERAHRHDFGALWGYPLTWHTVYENGRIETETQSPRSGITYCVRNEYDDGCKAADGGRLMGEWEEFTVRDRPGREAWLVMRTDAACARPLTVYVNGRKAGVWNWGGEGEERWLEPRFYVPGLYLKGNDSIKLVPGGPADRYAYRPFYYWLYQ